TTTGGITAINPLSQKIPERHYLYQNYPNPFNPNSKIKFQISKLGYVELTVFDILGREVAVLVNEELKAGTYEVYFDGTNFTSGVYFYRLEAGDYTETRKMVLVK
ncbi:MAG: T9SS type A sorting domain-containing protein, partial [Ignavibacteria bacterium]